MATMPSTPPRRIVVLEESALSSMARNQAFVEEFPFLSQLATPGQPAKNPGCGGCRGRTKVTRERLELVSQVKQTIAGMGEERKRRLKQLLHTQRVRISYRSGNRIVDQVF
jgi:hypothetical protein